MSDIEKLIQNLDDSQLDFLVGIVSRLATIKEERWTGTFVIEGSANQGGIGDSHFNRREKIVTFKRRKVRSRGA